jgi:protein gp37
MGRHSNIEWCHHTFNPWWGCTKVSPACAHCYAADFAQWRAPGHWGSEAPRKMQSATTWREPLRWNRAAKRRGRRERVFCASMADVFEPLADDHPSRSAVDEARARLWDMIDATPHLDWLLLTKRPEHIADHAPFAGELSLRNVWLGTTVEDDKRAAERLPHLVRAPAVVRFVSCEPLLAPLDLRPWLGELLDTGEQLVPRGSGERGLLDRGAVVRRGLDWVITGGESGRSARASSPAWFDDLREQCELADVPFFFKQWGSWAPTALLTDKQRRRIVQRVEVDGHELRKIAKRADRPQPVLKQGAFGRWKAYQEFPKQAQLFAA